MELLYKEDIMAKKKAVQAPTFYDISNILSLNATYNIIYGTLLPNDE